jgi:hypothetical protein
LFGLDALLSLLPFVRAAVIIAPSHLLIWSPLACLPDGDQLPACDRNKNDELMLMKTVGLTGVLIQEPTAPWQ